MRRHTLRRVPLLTAALASALVAIAAQPRPPEPRPQDPDAGRVIFEGRGTCFACHGADARGTALAPDLTDGEWVNFESRPTAAEVEALVKAGVPKPVRFPAPMPPMGGARLSEADLGHLAAYILSLAPEAAASNES